MRSMTGANVGAARRRPTAGRSSLAGGFLCSMLLAQGPAATAAGARKWNDANVLALSLRSLSEPVATEIVEAWLTNDYAKTEDESLRVIGESERRP